MNRSSPIRALSGRPKKCKCGCGTSFVPTKTLQVAASPECALRIAVKHRENEEKATARRLRQIKRRVRKETKAKLEKLKTLSQWLKEAQVAVNAYIRERDKNEPCISCQRFHQGSYDAGHYRSVGAAPELRFHEDNIHRQCVPCNQHKSGNAIEYRIGLVKRKGLEVVEWLEGPHPPKKYTKDEAKAIRDEYRAKLKALQALESRP